MFYIDLDNTYKTRYDMAKFMNFDVDNYEMLTSYFLTELMKLESSGNRVIVNEVQRPDLLSYNIYGSTQYWWILMEYNKLTDPSDLVAGLTINYPTLSQLEELYLILNTQSIGVS